MKLTKKEKSAVVRAISKIYANEECFTPYSYSCSALKKEGSNELATKYRQFYQQYNYLFYFEDKTYLDGMSEYNKDREEHKGIRIMLLSLFLETEGEI